MGKTIEEAIHHGAIIEDYPDDPRGPSDASGGVTDLWGFIRPSWVSLNPPFNRDPARILLRESSGAVPQS